MLFRKLCPLIVLVVILLAIPLARSEDVISSESELLNNLAEHRDAHDTSFELLMSDDLYSKVRENSFRRFRQLEQLAGIKDDSLRYSFTQSLVQLSNIVWGEITAKECDTLEDVQNAVAEMIGKGAKSFELICSDPLFSSLRNSGLIEFYWESRIED